MGWIVELEITHLRFAIGGEHYYGTMQVRTKTVDGILHGGYNPEKKGEHPKYDRKIDVKRPLTSLKEVAYLNKKDNEGYPGFIEYYAKGDLVSRFNSPDDIPENAIRMFNEMFDSENDVLVYAEKKHSDPYKALAGNTEAVEVINSLDRTGQQKWLWENGYKGT